MEVPTLNKKLLLFFGFSLSPTVTFPIILLSFILNESIQKTAQERKYYPLVPYQNCEYVFCLSEMIANKRIAEHYKSAEEKMNLWIRRVIIVYNIFFHCGLLSNIISFMLFLIGFDFYIEKSALDFVKIFHQINEFARTQATNAKPKLIEAINFQIRIHEFVENYSSFVNQFLHSFFSFLDCERSSRQL